MENILRSGYIDTVWSLDLNYAVHVKAIICSCNLSKRKKSTASQGKVQLGHFASIQGSMRGYKETLRDR